MVTIRNKSGPTKWWNLVKSAGTWWNLVEYGGIEGDRMVEFGGNDIFWWNRLNSGI